MAKVKRKTQDKHKSGFLVRLPVEYRAKLLAMKKGTDLPITAIVRRALDAVLPESGK